MGTIATRLTALVFCLYLLLGQRLTVGAATGGRGTVSVLELAFVALAAAMWLVRGASPANERPPRFFAVTVGPLFALLVVLPTIGVVVGDYELRNLYTVIVVLVPLAILALGATATRFSVDVRRFVFVAILGHGFYGLGQQLYRLGIMPSSAWSWAAAWDVSSQQAYDDLYVLSGRSTGLFINPNAFGLWSVLATLFGALYLRGTPRVVAVALGLAGVIGCQSRTAWLALALLGLVYAISFLASTRVARSGALMALLLAPVVVLLGVGGVLGRLVEEGAQVRLISGIAGLTEGGDADANLGGRYVGWARAQEFVSQYAVGTLGPPQVKFGGSIDSQFVTYYLQGGPLLVAAFVLALVSPLVVLRRRLPGWWKLGLMSGVIAVFSATGNPLDSPMTCALLWLAASLSLHEAVRDGTLLERDPWSGRRAVTTAVHRPLERLRA
ncbi:hypothetical protein ACK8HX_09900 [Oryzobacter sp. R7]|uniref:hypothetical protein n=1 Tax=Oryzobacter faecalis TaxID=3388656 RepID=UPI00398CEAFE